VGFDAEPGNLARLPAIEDLKIFLPQIANGVAFRIAHHHGDEDRFDMNFDCRRLRRGRRQLRLLGRGAHPKKQQQAAGNGE
jgi:hypothetical protein